MTTTIILTILSFCAICIVPFVFLHWKAKRVERATLENLFNFAQSNHDRIAHYNLLDHLAIGLSTESNNLFFINNDQNRNIREVVNLSEVAKCNLNKPIRRSLDGKDSTIERIELIFTFKDKHKLIKQIEFYDLEHQSLTLNGELQLAEKWHAEIVTRLKVMSQVGV